MRKNRLTGLLAAVFAVVVLAVGGLYLASPWMAMNALKSALARQDRDRLQELIDFPSVRENLKADFNLAMNKRIANDPEMRDNPFAGLATVMMPALVDRLVEATVTPATLSNLGGEPALGGEADATGPKGKTKTHHRITAAYADLNRFRITQGIDDGQTIGWILSRQGLFQWRLTRIELPSKLFEAGEG